MSLILIRTALADCMGVLYILAASRILDMRSNRLFFTWEAVCFAFDAYLYVFETEKNMLHTIGSVTAYLLLPAIMSTNPMRTRIPRITLLYSVVMLTELLGTSIYSILNHGVTAPEPLTEDNAFSSITVYLILIFTVGIILEAVVSAFRRLDGARDLSFEMPTAALLLVSALMTTSSYMRLMYPKTGLGPTAFASLIYCWVSLLAIYLIFWTARREAKAQREMAEHAIAARRVKHTRREVEGMAWRAEGMSSLRHDLANQVRDIAKLAEGGETDEASRRLSKLSVQVQVISGKAQTASTQE